MPSLMAIISADSNPMKRELASVQRMAAQTGVGIQAGLSGAGGGPRAGAIREPLVLMREMSRGNWTRVPGSFTLLLDKMGILSKLSGSAANAAKILADAWELQAQKAGIAAVAATRKAAASIAAFEADEENTAATLEQAVADETAAGAAIQNQKATALKAQTAREAAVAEELNAGATAATVGPIGIVIGVVAGLAAGMFAAYKIAGWLKDRLTGFSLDNKFQPEIIARRLQGSNANLEAERKITEQVQKTVEAYHSAAAASERAAAASKEHYDHLLRMAEFEKDPVKRAEKVAAINKQRDAEEIENLKKKMIALDQEADNKKAAADEMGLIPSEKHDAEIVAKKKADATAARKYLDETADDTNMFTKRKALRALNKMANTGVKDEDITASDEAGRKFAQDIIKAEKTAVEEKDKNDLLREKRDALRKQEGKAREEAAGLGQAIPDTEKSLAQKRADEADEAAKKLASEKGGEKHGPINALQKIGAYATPAFDATLSVARKSEKHLQIIKDHIVKEGGFGPRLRDGTFGGNG